MKHKARPVITGWHNVPGIDRPVAEWSPTCQDCGRPVREMFHLSDHGRRHVFYHSAGKAAPGDPRRGPRPVEWNEAISKGMKAANIRRRDRQKEKS
jgi:hypothetical protein